MVDTERIGVCSWSLRPNDAGHLADLVAELGIGAVQVALSPLVTAMAGAEPRGTDAGAGIEQLRERRLRIASGMMAFAGEDYSTLETIAATGGVRPDAAWEANLAHAGQVAALAAAADVGLVTFHAGFIPEERGDAERAALLDRLRAVAACFDRHGIALGLETGQETADTLAEALDDLACDNVGVNFDPANMILYAKGDPVAALRALAPRVVQIHVKDALPTTTPGTWGTEVPAGRGAVDWPAFFAAAGELDPPVDFIIEREAGETRMADIAAARDLIASHLATTKG